MSRRVLNRVGMRYGRLTVIGQAPSRGKNTRWICRCRCGRVKEIASSCLVSGETRSCGCLKREVVIRLNQLRAMERQA